MIPVHRKISSSNINNKNNHHNNKKMKNNNKLNSIFCSTCIINAYYVVVMFQANFSPPPPPHPPRPLYHHLFITGGINFRAPYNLRVPYPRMIRCTFARMTKSPLRMRGWWCVLVVVTRSTNRVFIYHFGKLARILFVICGFIVYLSFDFFIFSFVICGIIFYLSYDFFMFSFLILFFISHFG
jgi:hypothetical protein